MLSEKILDVLDENDFSHSPVQVEKDFFGTTQCYVEIGWYSPAGEDFSATIWFDGTDEDFVEKFAEYANDFDVDDHVSMWADSLGRNGVPSTYKELVNDAQAIQDALTDVAAKLGGKAGADPAEELLMEPERCTMLTLSTAHVRPETMRQIETGEIMDGWLPCYAKLNPSTGDVYGAFVCIGDIDREERNTMPADLAQIWDYCKQKSIEWVMFDCDAQKCAKFTDFTKEWEKEGDR